MLMFNIKRVEMNQTIKLALTTFTLLFSLNAHPLEKGQPLPYFSLLDLRSGKIVHGDDFKGKVLYIDFWATWCTPCIEGLPKLSKLQNAFARDQFQIVAINVNEDIQVVKDFLKQIDTNIMVLSDPENIALTRFKLKGIPTGYLIDQDGKVVFSHTGYDSEYIKQLKKAVSKQIKRR